jgi:hypothetical protein
MNAQIEGPISRVRTCASYVRLVLTPLTCFPTVALRGFAGRQAVGKADPARMHYGVPLEMLSVARSVRREIRVD